jgi:hypothetical protein
MLQGVLCNGVLIQRLATGWTVRVSNPSGCRRYSVPHTHPAICAVCIVVLTGDKAAGLGRLTAGLRLALRVREESYNPFSLSLSHMARHGMMFTFI